MLFHI